MRNLLAFVAAMALTFFGLGYYLSWYQIVTVPGPDGHSRVTIDIDGKKIKEDVAKGAERGAEKIHEFMEKKGDTARGDNLKQEAARQDVSRFEVVRKADQGRGPSGE